MEEFTPGTAGPCKTLSGAEGRVLYCLAQQCSGKGAIVAIGPGNDQAIVWLAHGSKDGKRARIYTVNFPTRLTPVWPDDVAAGSYDRSVQDLVRPLDSLPGDAVHLVPEPVELAVFTGFNSSNGENIAIWHQKVIPDGIMVFFNQPDPAVKRLVEEKVYNSGRFRAIIAYDSILVATKAIVA